MAGRLAILNEDSTISSREWFHPSAMETDDFVEASKSAEPVIVAVIHYCLTTAVALMTIAACSGLRAPGAFADV